MAEKRRPVRVSGHSTSAYSQKTANFLQFMVAVSAGMGIGWELEADFSRFHLTNRQ
jgi:hypothetical protein